MAGAAVLPVGDYNFLLKLEVLIGDGEVDELVVILIRIFLVIVILVVVLIRIFFVVAVLVIVLCVCPLLLR